MKTKLKFHSLFIVVTCLFGVHQVAAQGTAFTYQGQLQDNGVTPANGRYDLTFALFTTSSAGSQLGGTLTNTAVAVTNGLFMVTEDFGAVFNGLSSYWVQIGLRTNGGGLFTALTPRQQVTPSPFAIYAEGAGQATTATTATTANSVAAGSVTGAGIASGQVVKSLNGLGDAVTLSPGANVTITPSGNTLTIAGTGGGGTGWSLTGNAGTAPGTDFLGTVDNEPLELWVNGARAFRLEPGGASTYLGNGIPTGAPNVIGGARYNFVSGGVVGAAIGGGGATNYQATPYTNSVTGDFGTVGGGGNNTAGGEATVGGGLQNTAGGTYATVGGGYGNTVSGSDSTVGGGSGNTASGLGQATVAGGSANSATGIHGSTVGGGQNNAVSGGYDGTVGGGSGNTVSGGYATIPGGYHNVASGGFSFAAGQQAQATNAGAFVWADSQTAPFTSTANDSFNVRAQGGVQFVTGGAGLTVDGQTVLTTGGTVTNVSLANVTNLTLNNLTVSGRVTLPATATVYAGASSVLYADQVFDFFAGQGAGTLAGTGIGNTAAGAYAFAHNVSGSFNTAVGVEALNKNSSAGYNTALGAVALFNNTTGSNNAASGYNALNANTSGSYNTADGNQALLSNLTGNYNTAVGDEAMKSTAGNDNSEVAIGFEALENDNAGRNPTTFSGDGENTAIGYQALRLDTLGLGNTAVGYQALYANTNGIYNTAIGDSALSVNTSGNDNTALGYYAMLYNTSGKFNTVVGDSALEANTAGNNNTVMGYNAMTSNPAPENDVAIGIGTFQTATEGAQNTALGTYAFQNATAGDGNIGIGYNAGHNLITGNNNIYLGNVGNSTESGIIRIGTPGTQTSTYLAGDAVLNGALNIDQTGTYGQNGGTVASNALTFGTGPGGSGEGIASQRTSGVNQFDLALYTGFLARLTILSSGNVGIGTASPQNTLDVNGITRTHSIIITGGSDLAEPFPITKADQPITEGEVVVIDEANPGQLKLTDQPYDTHVAGVVSGANGVNPGIQMQQQGLLEGGKNVALTGRVYVQAGTANGAIKPGDLLTTSSTPGRAMKVTDHVKAQGAILGKAMTSLKEGNGMVLVLVTLQ